jgi:hypothetical protein
MSIFITHSFAEGPGFIAQAPRKGILSQWDQPAPPQGQDELQVSRMRPADDLINGIVGRPRDLQKPMPSHENR